MRAAESARPRRTGAAIIGARVFVSGGRYYTDSSLVFELVILAARFEEFWLHCFVISGQAARDELALPASVRLVSLGDVRSGRDLYGHPLRLGLAIARHVRAGRWPLVVLAEPSLTSLLGLAACRLAGKRAIALVRGDPRVWRVAQRQRSGPRALAGFALWLLRMTTALAVARTVPVVTDSAAVAGWLRRYGGPVRPIGAASVTERDVLEPAESWRGPGLGPLRLLYVGRLELVKDLTTLISGVAAAAAAGASLQLSVVGSGDRMYVKALSDQIARLGLRDLVDLRGPMPHGPQLFACYQRAHVFVMSSRSEGMPKAAIEAMAHGLPVVATAVGGLPDLIGTDAGLLVPAGDARALGGAIAALHDSTTLAAAMGGAARKVAHDYLAGPASEQLAAAAVTLARRPGRPALGRRSVAAALRNGD